eukprot:TRINITY_DN11432_c2_g1_i1.p1 TRINITY_DN11432_c2_g1~~TRINITY_DN11432_c2_g1_i1.p1  ORF type:complete len:606 (+),score=185.10 TRINITY_DN11432_c2_g1_i1:62-1819(+)
MPASGAAEQAPCVESLMPWEFAAELAAAARAGDAARCRSLVAASADCVDSADSTHNGFTALCWAAWEGHDAAVTALLDAGADPNARDNDGQTPLFNASWHGHLGCVSALICAGADPAISDRDGDTPLLASAKRGHYAVCQRLAMAGANPMQTDDEGRTARAVAVDAGHAALAQGLEVYEARWAELQHRKQEQLRRKHQEEARKRADLARRYSEWLAGRERAAEEQRSGLEAEEGAGRRGESELEHLTRRSLLSIADDGRRTAAFSASRRIGFERERAMRRCISSDETARRCELESDFRNASWAPFVGSESGQTPRSGTTSAESAGAVEYDATSVEDQLTRLIWKTQGVYGGVDGREKLKQLAEKASTGTGDQTDLCDAARDGDVLRCQELVSAGCPVDPPSGAVAQSALMWAAVGGKLPAVRWLVGAGACCVRRDACGYSAAFHAVHHGHADVLRYLCTAGADPHQRDSEGHDLVHWAAFTGDTQILTYLLDEVGVPGDNKDGEGRTALHWASRQGNAAAAELLLQRNESLRSMPDDAGMIPADHAQERFHSEVARLLARAGTKDDHRRRLQQLRIQPGRVYRHV